MGHLIIPLDELLGFIRDSSYQTTIKKKYDSEMVKLKVIKCLSTFKIITFLINTLKSLRN